MSEVSIEIKNMYKNFGATHALVDVSFSFNKGEIRGLIGENGSGKSTVSSIIAGIQQPTSGEMFLFGEKWAPRTSLEAQNAGIAMIVQEAGTIARISVAENIFLGNYKPFMRHLAVNRKLMNAEAAKALAKIGVTDIDPSLQCSHYSMEDRKLIEIARAMYFDPKILIVDETTTALAQKGRSILYRLIHEQAEKGNTVIMISHDLDEMMEHCDVLTVLRDGVVIQDIAKEDFSADLIKSRMVGREIQGNYYRTDFDGYGDEVVLKADCITTMKDLLCFDLELHKGEILGIGGLSDCGIHTIGRALYGLEDIVDGQVILPQKGNVVIDKPKTAFDNSVGYVSKNRDTESLELNASIKANIASTGYKRNRKGPFVNFPLETDYVANQINRLLIKCQGPWQVVRALSGGNKQKVVFGKWCAYDAQIMILDCPTRGVDIGVKAAMYQLIYSMKKEGKSIILISEELTELCGMSDRLLIIKDGRVSGEFFRKDGFDERVLVDYMI